MLLPLSILLLLSPTAASAANSTAPIPHPDPDSVADELHRLVQSSHRRALASTRKDQQHCPTGNPIDDCWLCSTSDWRTDRQRLADCGIGFGGTAAGGKGGPIYVVTDSSDNDPVNPTPGTLRHAVIQEGPLWITFASSMSIHLAEELLINSFKTLDARGVSVHIAGGACITLQYVSDIIIHGLYIHDCVPAGEANVRSSPTHYGWRTKSDGDGISIYGSRKIWIDHCELSRCADGLIDAIMGSTAITISNNYFWDHDDVMLMGHSDEYAPDLGMQVTIVFNKFGAGLVQRMPRCRLGYFHIVNNDYTEWEMYAIGGSASPTVNSQGNRYIAPADENAKEVTKRVDVEEGSWEGWNWRSVGDVMVNGAFFVASGEGMAARFEKAESVEPKTAALVEQLTVNAGVLGGARSGSATTGASGGNYGGPALAVGSGGGGGGGGGGGSRGFDALGMVYVSGAPPSGSILSISASAVMVIIFFVCMHLL